MKTTIDKRKGGLLYRDLQSQFEVTEDGKMFQLGTAHLQHDDRDRDIEVALRRRQMLEATRMTSRGVAPTRPIDSRSPRSDLRISPSAGR